MATKVKAEATNINLSGLNAAQLLALSIEAKVKSDELAEKESLAKIKTLKESGDFDALKKEFTTLLKEGKKLTRKATFDLMIPVRFTMDTEGDFDSLESLSGTLAFDEFGEEDLFNHKFDAALMKAPSGEPYTKKQRAALNTVIKDYAQNACDDIYEIIPEALMQHYDTYAAKALAFSKKVLDLGIDFKDLQ